MARGQRADHLLASPPPIYFSSWTLRSPLPCPPVTHPQLRRPSLCFCFLAASSEAQTIEVDDPTAESTTSPPRRPPPLQPEIMLPIAGAQAARLRPCASLLLLTGNEPRPTPAPHPASQGRSEDSSLALPPCWAPLCSGEAGRGWQPQPLESLLGEEPRCDLSGSARLPCSGLALRGAACRELTMLTLHRNVLEITECLGGKNKLGFQFPWKRHLFAEEPASESGPRAGGGGGRH